MPIREPDWWYGSRWSWQSVTLAPVAAIYGHLARRRMCRAPAYRSTLPVLCVGNFTAGGTGKTPLAITLSEVVRSLGFEPVFLTRGYGGTAQGPLLVDPRHATAPETGDEPLLLARAAPTMISRDRVAGAIAIEKTFAPRTVIIMDDGLQNPALAKTLTLAVVDVRRRFGNRMCIPAGPLRAPLSAQVPHAGVMVVTGSASDDLEHQALSELKHMFNGEILRSQVTPAGDLTWLRGARVLAFAGIANPERFFSLLESQAAVVTVKHAFPDHHAFTDAEAQSLLDEARANGARIVTTEKDFVRLQGMPGARGELRDRTSTVPVTMTFAEGDRKRLEACIRTAIERATAEAQAP